MTRPASLSDTAPGPEPAATPVTAPRPRRSAAARFVSFFPADQGTDPAWLLALIAVVSGTLAVARLGWAGVNTIWAEDGAVFYQGAVNHPLSSFFEPYQGYLAVTPRIIAEVLAPLPVSWVAAANAAGFGLAMGLLAALAYRACRQLIRTPWLRLVPVAVIALCPVGDETWDSNANLMWPMFVVVFLVLLWNPRRPVPIAAGAITAVLLTMTSPFGLLFAPVAVARIVALGRTRGSVIPAAAMAGALTQAAVMVADHGRQAYTTVLPGKLANGYAFAVAGRGFFGERDPVQLFGLRIVLDYGTLGALVFAAVVAAIAGAGVARRGRQCALAALALVYSVGYFAAVMVVSGIYLGKDGGDRYFVGPFLLLAFAVTVAFDAAVAGPPRRGTGPRGTPAGQDGSRPAGPRLSRYARRLPALAVCAALTACLAFSVALDWNKPQPQRQHPTWPAALASARAWCARQPGTATTRIRIASAHPSIPWYVRLPCSKAG